MNKIIILSILFIFLSVFNTIGKENMKDTALLLIDIQNFYFPGGKSALVNPELASLNARKLLEKFREQNLLVVHVRHNYEPGGEIHNNVQPLKTEKVISKDNINCFKDIELLSYLHQHGIKKLVICGMMTNICVEAATRAAHDYGFINIVVSDACATRAFKFNNREISAEDVHYATLASLTGYYAKVVNTETLLKEVF